MIYASMQNPQWHERIISPHTLVYTGFRWHVRAYCHQSKQFKDFLLSRIDRTPVVVAIESVDPAQDQQWHEEIVLTLIPNPKLNAAQKRWSKKTSACLMADYRFRSKSPGSLYLAAISGRDHAG